MCESFKRRFPGLKVSSGFSSSYSEKTINSPGSPTSIFLFWPGKAVEHRRVQPSQEGEP